MDTDKILMEMEDGSEIEFSILETTRLGGVDYLLVTDAAEDEDGECYVMKDVSEEGDEEAVYESVQDEEELAAVFAVFEKLLDGEIDIER